MTSAIDARDVGKQYRFSSVPKSTTLKDLIVRRIRSDGDASVIDALQDVSFSVAKGQTLGVIGRNGSGKSTLLRVLAGIVKPDRGSVRLSGAPVPILALGAGFNPYLTGRENATIELLALGLTRAQARSMLPDIFEFSELAEFADVPLRAYSSGMSMRLAFSAAVCVEPDILLVDEVLAVGDERFARKCVKCIEELRDRGSATVLVTHEPAMVVGQCDVALWLENGRVAAFGEPRTVVAAYHDACTSA